VLHSRKVKMGVKELLEDMYIFGEIFLMLVFSCG